MFYIHVATYLFLVSFFFFDFNFYHSLKGNDFNFFPVFRNVTFWRTRLPRKADRNAVTAVQLSLFHIVHSARGSWEIAA